MPSFIADLNAQLLLIMHKTLAALILATVTATASAEITSQCTPAQSDPSLSGYLDLKSAVATVLSDKIQVVLYLRSIPETLPFNRFANALSCTLSAPCYSEYVWGVILGSDGTMARDSSEDYNAQVNYIPHQDPAKIVNTKTAPWTTFFGAYNTEKKAYFSSNNSTSAFNFNIDTQAATITLNLPKPVGQAVQPPIRIYTSERDGTGKTSGASCELNYVNSLPQSLFSLQGSLADGVLQTSATGSLDTLTLSGILSLPNQGSYNLYVFALLPGYGLLALSNTGWQAVTNLPLPTYAKGVTAAQGSQASTMNIFTDTPITSLRGLEIYVGYANDDNDLLKTMRLRGIYKGPK